MGELHSPCWSMERISVPMERACEEHKLTFNDDNYSSLVLSEVVIEHLLSAWRTPTSLHSQSSPKSHWVTISQYQIGQFVQSLPNLLFVPCSLNTDLALSDKRSESLDSTKFASIFMPLTRSLGSSLGSLSFMVLYLFLVCFKSRLLSP